MNIPVSLTIKSVKVLNCMVLGINIYCVRNKQKSYMKPWRGIEPQHVGMGIFFLILKHITVTSTKNVFLKQTTQGIKANQFRSSERSIDFLQ